MTAPRVADLLREKAPIVSFEFFPPKTESGWKNLFRRIEREFMPLAPGYVSVTYGAGGSTRQKTHDLVESIQRQFGLTVVAHLTCAGSTTTEIDEILDRYAAAGVRNILALRGDPPKDAPPVRSDFAQAADLVRHVRERHPDFSIGVAGFAEGHPATPNRLLEVEYMKRKVEAGADYIVTQLFFDNRDYFDYTERLKLAGVRVPVVPGLMPIRDRKGMVRMAELAAGARFPAALLRSIDRAQTEERVADVGVHWAVSQAAELLNREVPGLHLYTLNHSSATIELCHALGLESFSLRKP